MVSYKVCRLKVLGSWLFYLRMQSRAPSEANVSINLKESLQMVDETNRWNRETHRAPSETKSRLTNEKAFDDKKSTNSCFN
jgi:hypothetical protein